MTRTTTLSMLAALTLSTLPAAALADDTGNGDPISVSAPRQQVTGYSLHRARIVRYTVSDRVGVRDIDLASASGMAMLDRRVSQASRMACIALDRAIPINDVTGSADCERSSARSAMRAARANSESLTAVGALTFGIAAN